MNAYTITLNVFGTAIDYAACGTDVDHAVTVARSICADPAAVFVNAVCDGENFDLEPACLNEELEAELEHNAMRDSEREAEMAEVRAEAWHEANTQPSWMEEGNPYSGTGDDW
jgi:hypothetical protein